VHRRTTSLRRALLLVGGLLAVACSDPASAPLAARQPLRAVASSGRVSFDFDGNVKGFPTGEVHLNGGGSYAPATATNDLAEETSLASGGSFDCILPVEQSKLNGCKKDEGVRWDAEHLLASTSFKCTGANAEPLKPVVTDAHTAIIQADFYRAGDGNDESFSAQMIVSQTDIAPDIEGVQTLWIQGVGCGTADVRFTR
jgi:hypothetical protein